mmetsp:Transcript_57728/g.125543  ORF Transcript_57728/g.125543 Transcript_57728/m.125543 type:complete len:220 (+) Transcript_57728:792-1451(+)
MRGVGLERRGFNLHDRGIQHRTRCHSLRAAGHRHQAPPGRTGCERLAGLVTGSEHVGERSDERFGVSAGDAGERRGGPCRVQRPRHRPAQVPCLGPGAGVLGTHRASVPDPAGLHPDAHGAGCGLARPRSMAGGAANESAQGRPRLGNGNHRRRGGRLCCVCVAVRGQGALGVVYAATGASRARGQDLHLSAAHAMARQVQRSADTMGQQVQRSSGGGL